jgi:hypothetical protein
MQILRQTAAPGPNPNRWPWGPPTEPDIEQAEARTWKAPTGCSGPKGEQAERNRPRLSDCVQSALLK